MDIFRKSVMIGIWVLVLIPTILAFNTASNSYSSNLTIISSSGENISSTDYTMQVAISQIVKNETNSKDYKSCVGFFCMLKEYPLWEGVPIRPEYPGGGPGGSGGIANSELLPRFDFTVISTLKTQVTRGKMTEEVLYVKNTGNQPMIFSIENNLPEFILLSDNYFTLEPNQEKRILVSVFSKDKDIPGIYTDFLEIMTEQLTKKIGIILEIKEKEALFDVKLKVSEGSKKITPGMKILANLDMFNLGELKDIDIILEYWIENQNKTIIDHRKESLAVNERVIITKDFRLPYKMEEGIYSFNAKLIYGKDNKEASASEIFEVVNEIPLWRYILNFIENYYIWFVITLLTIIVIYNQIRIIKKVKRL